MKTGLQFPGAPAVEAQWVPVYLEPVVGSGERLAVAIACIDSRQGYLISKIVPEQVLKCMYGSAGTKISNLVDWVTESLTEHLDQKRNLDGWAHPFDGVIVGQIMRGQGASLQEVASQAAVLVSSLFRPVYRFPSVGMLSLSSMRAVGLRR